MVGRGGSGAKESNLLLWIRAGLNQSFGRNVLTGRDQCFGKARFR